jgi:hypothetical protein
MKILSIIAVSAAVSLPLAAATPEPYKSTLMANCTPSCVVTVIVPFGCGSGIRVAPDPIVVKKGVDSKITWNVTGQWEFDPANGIFIHNAGTAFTKHERGANSFTVVINHPNPAVFKYDVNLVGKSGTCRLDPTVVNQ